VRALPVWMCYSDPAVSKRPSKRLNHTWSVYRLRGTPAQLIGVVYDQPDEQTAIKRAIEQFEVPENSATA
jgi:hypothetical protein